MSSPTTSRIACLCRLIRHRNPAYGSAGLLVARGFPCGPGPASSGSALRRTLQGHNLIKCVDRHRMVGRAGHCIDAPGLGGAPGGSHQVLVQPAQELPPSLAGEEALQCRHRRAIGVTDGHPQPGKQHLAVAARRQVECRVQIRKLRSDSCAGSSFRKWSHSCVVQPDVGSDAAVAPDPNAFACAETAMSRTECGSTALSGSPGW